MLSLYWYEYGYYTLMVSSTSLGKVSRRALSPCFNNSSFEPVWSWLGEKLVCWEVGLVRGWLGGWLVKLNWIICTITIIIINFIPIITITITSKPPLKPSPHLLHHITPPSSSPQPSLELTSFKRVKVSLEVGTSRLGSSTNGHALAVKEVCRRTCLVDVRTQILWWWWRR